jgi:hypothetical protein
LEKPQNFSKDVFRYGQILFQVSSAEEGGVSGTHIGDAQFVEDLILGQPNCPFG